MIDDDHNGEISEQDLKKVLQQLGESRLIVLASLETY